MQEKSLTISNICVLDIKPMYSSFNKSCFYLKLVFYIICDRLMYLDTHGVPTLSFRGSENLIGKCGTMQEETCNYNSI